MGLSVAYGSEMNNANEDFSLKRLERTQAKMLLNIMNKKGRVNQIDSERANDYLTQSRSEALEELKVRDFKTLSSIVSN